MAQTAVIVNEEDDTKYASNPFVGFTIKPNTFNDGADMFYTDSSKANLLFEGNIVNGKTEGVYYAYNVNREGDIRPDTKTVVHSRNGSFDGCCKIDANMNDKLTSKYLFKFDKGELTQLKVINPFFRFFYKERNDTEPVDTLSFSFQNGRLEAVTFYNDKAFYNITPALTSNLLDDTMEINKLVPAERYYMYSYESKDSSQIAYLKDYKFTENGTNRNNRIALVYDSLKTVKSLNLIAAFPWIYNPFDDWREDTTDYSVKMVEIRFDRNKILQGIEGKTLLKEMIQMRGEAKERILEVNDYLLLFKREGTLDMEK